jgi:hypothetical protein
MKKVVTAVVAVFVLTVLVQADSYVKQTMHQDGFEMMGQKQPPTDEIIEQWISTNQMAMVRKGNSIIVDLDKGAVFVVNHNAKTYVEMALPLDLSKYMPPGPMSQMLGQTKVTVTPNGQTQTVGQWNCDGYDMTMDMMGGMMKLNSKIWASKEVAIDWQALSDKLMPLVTQASMRLSDEAMAEFAKIKGLQIKSESSMEMMGTQVKMSQEVLEISTKPAPTGVYEVPAGYTKRDQFSMQDMRQ